MKIRKMGWTTFVLSTDNISVATDPIYDGKSINGKVEADVILLTNYEKDVKKGIIIDNGLQNKIVPDKRKSVMEIYSPGEYEVGGIMIRRGLEDNFYIVDERNIRVVYMGGTGKDFDPQKAKNLGDVDVLIVPIGNGDLFMDYEVLEKVISNMDPAILIPCGYAEDSKNGEKVKSSKDFLEYFGFANVREENYYNVAKKKVDEENQSSVEVIFLK
ncbi:MAG TPA: MBL fold metallo-hydrolase [Candidatus Dojkabacteria bacterium]|nr:MBL fold metallo-hydrolase [Candidatus Dojkabacteria bacterium]